jgi:hypothetical protein
LYCWSRASADLVWGRVVVFFLPKMAISIPCQPQCRERSPNVLIPVNQSITVWQQFREYRRREGEEEQPFHTISLRQGKARPSGNRGALEVCPRASRFLKPMIRRRLRLSSTHKNPASVTYSPSSEPQAERGDRALINTVCRCGYA